MHSNWSNTNLIHKNTEIRNGKHRDNVATKFTNKKPSGVSLIEKAYNPNTHDTNIPIQRSIWKPKGACPLPRGEPQQPQHLGLQDAHHGVHLLPQRLWQHLPHGCFSWRGVPYLWHPGLNSLSWIIFPGTGSFPKSGRQHDIFWKSGGKHDAGGSRRQSRPYG